MDDTSLMVTVIQAGHSQTLPARQGQNLRAWLLQQGFSPYARLTRTLNCGGRGLCATCGVWIVLGEPLPSHWHDKLAYRYGYARLSCQITITQSMTVHLDDEKRVWGKRRTRRA